MFITMHGSEKVKFTTEIILYNISRIGRSRHAYSARNIIGNAL